MDLLSEPPFSVSFQPLMLVVSERSESAEGLGILIFIAILMHKAPASIGFGTFLHHEGLSGFGLAKPLLVIHLLS